MVLAFIRDFILTAGTLGVPLGVVRWRKGKLEVPLTLAVLARTAGTITLLLGAGHLLEIGVGMAIGKRLYDLHDVEVLWIGGLLVFSGSANLLASGGLRRGEIWAWGASGAVSIFVWLFTLSLIPVTTGGAMDSTMVRVLFFMHSLYLAYWASHRPEPAIK